MCKILTVSGIKAEPGVTKRFAETAMAVLTERDFDGCGYAATDGNEIFTEKWLYPKDAFKVREEKGDIERELIKRFNGVLDCGNYYASTGTVDLSLNSVKTITLHARMSTNLISLENTHPFVAQDTSLIHNGIISNHNDYRKTLSSCDSESILTAYLKSNVREKPAAIQKLFDGLTGYYACSVLSKTSQGVLLDVFKCSKASLVFCLIKELGNAYAWVTDLSQMEEICRRLGWDKPRFFVFDAYVLARINTLTNDVEVTKGKAPLSAVSSYYNEAWWERDEAERRAKAGYEHARDSYHDDEMTYGEGDDDVLDAYQQMEGYRTRKKKR